MNDKYYARGAQERDQVLVELRALKMLDPSFDARGVVAGRNLGRKLTDLGNDEFKTFLDVFSRFCGKSEKDSL